MVVFFFSTWLYYWRADVLAATEFLLRETVRLKLIGIYQCWCTIPSWRVKSICGQNYSCLSEIHLNACIVILRTPSCGLMMDSKKIICSCLINPRAEIALPSPSRYIKLMVNAVLLFKEFMLFFMVVDIKNNYFNPQGVVKKKYFNLGADVSRLSL